MELTCSNCDQITSWAPAANLNVYMTIYQMGIVKINVEDPNETTFKRFRVSDYNVGVEWS